MVSFVRRCALAALTLPLFAPLAAAQDDKRAPGVGAEAIIYRDLNFRGPAVSVSRARPDLGLAWPVNSIRIYEGRWELCGRTNYRSPCRTFDNSQYSLSGQLGFAMVKSMRPVGGSDGGGGGGGRPGPSLRGMAGEFYVAPGISGERVLACRRGQATANCASESADAFCRSMGWTASASEKLQSEGRRVYLADVLCTRTGY